MTLPFSAPARLNAALAALALLACGTGPSSERENPHGLPDWTAQVGIQYGLLEPAGPRDYPYSGQQPGPEPDVGGKVFLSAIVPEMVSAKLQFLWAVSDASGRTASVLPTPRASRVHFELEQEGVYRVALVVTAESDADHSVRAELQLRARPRSCEVGSERAPCASSLPVAGGEFLMGSPAGAGVASEWPEHSAKVTSFALDRFEVTVGRFQPFFRGYAGVPPEVGDGAHPAIGGSGWRAEWNGELPVNREQLRLAFEDCGGTFDEDSPASDTTPLNCVSWYEAFAFCISEGARLPTEAEWEYAAAGGAEDRVYPWGAASPSQSLSIFDCTFDGNPACTAQDLPEVGSARAGAGRFGHDDLAGSLWEWVLDRYGPYASSSCEDCALLDAGEGRVFRGGGFDVSDVTLLRSAARLGFDAEHRDATRGFRCARHE